MYGENVINAHGCYKEETQTMCSFFERGRVCVCVCVPMAKKKEENVFKGGDGNMVSVLASWQR